MSVINRMIEAVLPSQELMEMERTYIRRTGRTPTKQQEKRWKKETRGMSRDTER